MNTRIRNLIAPIVWGAVIIFGVCFLIIRPQSVDDFSSCVSYTISVVAVLFFLYEKWLWRLIPWNRPPILKKEYDGTIKYKWEGESRSKDIQISVEQTLLTVRITTKTDINSSRALTGDIVEEHGAYFLYYTYITNPSAQYRDENPIQYGTCRLELTLDENKTMTGHYWTSAKTVGDITWKEKSDPRLINL